MLRGESKILRVLQTGDKGATKHHSSSVLDFAPGATSKINKLFILSQLRLVEEWREKLDDDFLFS